MVVVIVPLKKYNENIFDGTTRKDEPYHTVDDSQVEMTIWVANT